MLRDGPGTGSLNGRVRRPLGDCPVGGVCDSTCPLSIFTARRHAYGSGLARICNQIDDSKYKKASAGCKKYQPRDIAVTETSSKASSWVVFASTAAESIAPNAREPVAAPEGYGSKQQKKRTHNQRAV